MVRNMMYGLLGCLMLSSLACVRNIVHYPPRSHVGNSQYFVIIDSKPIGRNIQEVFVTVYGKAGNVYALREFEIPIESQNTLIWNVNWESLDRLSIDFYSRKYKVRRDKFRTREIESHHVFSLTLGYDSRLGTFVETADSDIPVQKWRT